MNQPSYIDFDLKISRQGECYTVTAGNISGSFNLGQEFVEAHSLELGCGGLNLDAVRKLGEKLFRLVFSDKVLDCFNEGLDNAFRKRKKLRLRLRLQNAPDLMNLPWEFLFHPDRRLFLAETGEIPIIRYLDVPQIQPPPPKLPLRILVAVSSPAGHRLLSVKKEKILIEKALGKLVTAGKVAVTVVKGIPEKIRKHLQDEDYHVFHFIGHGGFDENCNEGMLLMQDWQDDEIQCDLSTLIPSYRTLQLAVLNSCDSAWNDPKNPFSGAATALIQNGLTTVVAMQCKISDDAAVEFTSSFYNALANGFPVDAAMVEGRIAVSTREPGNIEWGTPVLYTSSPDEILFRLPQPEIRATGRRRYINKEVKDKIRHKREWHSVLSMSYTLNNKRTGKPNTDTIRFIQNLCHKCAEEQNITHLINEFENPDYHVRRFAAKSLGEIGGRFKVDQTAIVPQLIKLIDRDEDMGVRWRAVWALGAIRPDSDNDQVVKFLSKLLSDKRRGNEPVRWRAAWAMGEMKTEKAAQLLADIANDMDEDKNVRRSAIRALGAIQSSGAEMILNRIARNEKELFKVADWALKEIARLKK